MAYIIPFGHNCSTAAILQAGNLRRFALPFDWIFAFPEHIKRSLDNNFEDWFDLQNLKVFKKGDTVSTAHNLYPLTNDLYIKKAIGIFEHHDMTSKKDREQFRRNIDRYNTIINSASDIVFFSLISYDQLKYYGLLDYYTRENVYWVVVEYTSNPAKYIEIKNIDENKTLIKQYSPEFADNDLWVEISQYLDKTYKITETLNQDIFQMVNT
jgi:hypothetical protein